MAENALPHQRCFGLMTFGVRLKSRALAKSRIVHARLDSSADERMQHARKGTAMYRCGLAIARMIAPAFNAGRVRRCVSISKTMAKTTTKTV
ncbi:hypothetical protein WMC41_20420 [Shinella yambaruensis]|uniref:hypothetical protein n=1 Tax=Shinella yambaruensis TaxID=415996 RepID=UPI003D795EF4